MSTRQTKQMLMVALLAISTGIANAAYVTIGDANNTADTNGLGAVGYTYQICDHEVSIAEFQRATGAGDNDENWWNNGTTRNLGNNAPVACVSAYEAMKYCNWLTTGNINSGYYSTSDSGATWQANALSHDAYATANGITYFLSTEDEWYKAAYYTGNSSDYWSLYANGSDTAPTVTSSADGTGWNYNHENTDLPWTVGSSAEEQNGTYDMMGNLWEWIETGTSARGGNFYTEEDTLASSYVMARNPTDEFGTVSFRVVAVPEPGTVLLLIPGLGALAAWRRRDGLRIGLPSKSGGLMRPGFSLRHEGKGFGAVLERLSRLCNSLTPRFACSLNFPESDRLLRGFERAETLLRGCGERISTACNRMADRLWSLILR